MEETPVVLPIELSAAQVRPVAYRVISKKHGLNLKSTALTVLSKFLGHHFGADWRGSQAEKTLDEICRTWKDEDRGIFVDGPELSQVIKDWINAEVAVSYSSQRVEKKFDWRQYFKVVSATDQPRVLYDSRRKNFDAVSEENTRPFGKAKSLINVFLSRYYILLDKLYRSEKFVPPGFSTTIKVTTTHIITPIKNLLGRSYDSEFFLFGLLEKQQDGPWVLYDPSSSIELEFGNFSQFAPDHYYTSGSFVICHGQFTGSTFLVATMGPPSVEHREESQEAYGYLDFYGLNGSKKIKRIERLDPALQNIMMDEEEKMPQNRIVILGADLFLDKQPIFDSLKRSLLSLETNPPIALILCGSFISVPFQPHLTAHDGRNAAQIYRDSMNALADILLLCPNLSANTKLVFIPGPNDPWHSMSLNVLPFQHLPSVFTGRVDRAASDIVWATNPARLCYLTQEIVLFRNNCGSILRNNSLDTEIYQKDSDKSEAVDLRMDVDTSNNGDVQSTAQENDASDIAALHNLSLDDDNEERAANRAALHAMMDSNRAPSSFESNSAYTGNSRESRCVMATLLDQCHLSPLSISLAPVVWEYDHVLSMAQWPSALVVIDPTTSAMKGTYEGCHVMNPGSFYNDGRANFLEFWPTSGHFQFTENL